MEGDPYKVWRREYFMSVKSKILHRTYTIEMRLG